MPANKPPVPPPPPLRPPPEADDPAESQRFIDMAREIGADESPGAMDRALDRVVLPNAQRSAQPARAVRPKHHKD